MSFLTVRILNSSTYLQLNTNQDLGQFHRLKLLFSHLKTSSGTTECYYIEHPMFRDIRADIDNQEIQARFPIMKG